MDNQLEGISVFVHWKLAEAGFDRYVRNLQMIPVRDARDVDSRKIEARFLQSGADLALVSTLPFIFVASGDLLKSEVMRSRGVLVAHEQYDGSERELIKFNQSLEDCKFLYIWIDQVNDGHTLASLFLEALKNV